MFCWFMVPNFGDNFIDMFIPVKLFNFVDYITRNCQWRISDIKGVWTEIGNGDPDSLRQVFYCDYLKLSRKRGPRAPRPLDPPLIFQLGTCITSI